MSNDTPKDSDTPISFNFNVDTSGWELSNITDMSDMFSKPQFTGDISGWNLHNVKGVRTEDLDKTDAGKLPVSFTEDISH